MSTLQQMLVKITTLGDQEHLKRLKHLVGDTEWENHIRAAPLEKCESMIDVFDLMQKMDHVSKDNLDQFKKFMHLVFMNSPFQSKVEHFIKEYEDGCPGIQASDSTEDNIITDDGGGRWITGSSGVSQSQPGIISPTNRFNDLDASVRSVSVCLGTTISTDTVPPKRFTAAFEYAASKIGLDWKVFAELASIDQSTAYSIEVNLFPADIQKQADAAFKLWYDKQSKPSLTIFRKTLRSIPRNDIADDLKEMDKIDAK